MNHCDRSATRHVDGYPLLATADDLGLVTLYRYPTVVVPSTGLVCRGHSSYVSKVAFGKGGARGKGDGKSGIGQDGHMDGLGSHRRQCSLLSAGGSDHTLIEWKVEW